MRNIFKESLELFIEIVVMVFSGFITAMLMILPFIFLNGWLMWVVGILWVILLVYLIVFIAVWISDRF